jgi:hypothetical protein
MKMFDVPSLTPEELRGSTRYFAKKLANDPGYAKRVGASSPEQIIQQTLEVLAGVSPNTKRKLGERVPGHPKA